MDALGLASIPLAEPMRAAAAEAYGSERSEFQGDACGPKAAAPKSLDQCLQNVYLRLRGGGKKAWHVLMYTCVYVCMHMCMHACMHV